MMRRAWKVLGLTLALAVVLAIGASAAVEEQGGTDLWQDPGAVRFKFAHDPGAGGPWNRGLYINDGVGPYGSTLRVYGRCTEDAAFPYQTYQGPFDLTSPEAPAKDFVVFNPIFLDHWADVNSNYFHIKADGDANQKVHLRMWYVPKLEEPVGRTWPEVENKVSNYELYGDGDVVFEYTYILLDDVTNNPTHGQARKTQLVFPMAGQVGPKDGCGADSVVGLDNYDINCDGTDEILSIDAIALPDHLEPDATHTTLGEIWVSPEPTEAQGMRLEVGDPHNDVMEAGTYMDFLDYRVQLLDVSTDERKAQIGIWYIGRGFEQKTFIGNATLHQEGYGSGKDAALVKARFGPITVDHRDNLTPKAVEYPFWVTLDYLGAGGTGNDYATLTPHRVLTANTWSETEQRWTGETFFVDGAEYDVAAVFVLVDPDGTGNPEFKYITIRNPVPKANNISINTISVEKQGWQKSTAGNDNPAWLLPPFNHEGTHQYVDDINIPEIGTGPDVQRFDNLTGEGFTPPIFPPGTGLGWGAQSRIHQLFNTIEDRLVVDEALEILWLYETKEPRFDTNLMEEKFTEPEQKWQWINIESLPWDYTEFALPERMDAADLKGLCPVLAAADAGQYCLGDYLLVSSLITEDSTDFWPADGSVRVKFWHDVDYTLNPDFPPDIYVNDSGDGTRLRVYGRADENAAFPYLTFDGPFNLESFEAPAKDFVVHNPALFDHLRVDELEGPQGEDLRPMLRQIRALGDAHQKVHLRTWYVPEYDEPAGYTYPAVPDDQKVATADVVNEYTFLMLDDDTLDPTSGPSKTVKLAFPLAGAGYNKMYPGVDNQVGLDRYNINDTTSVAPANELMVVENIVPVANDTTLGEIWVSAESTTSSGMQLGINDSWDFLDYRVELLDISTDERKAEIAIYYIGNREPYLIGQATLQQEGWGSGKDAAVTQARFGPIYQNTRAYVEDNFVKAIEYPFWVTLEYLGSGSQYHGNHYAQLTPHRVLKAGETFFVDGAEYDVAAIYILADPRGMGPEFKYITIRNPIPKCEPVCNSTTDVCLQGGPGSDPCEVRIPKMSVIKKAVQPYDQTIWVLPPFNHDHDRVDDVNIPDNIQGYPNTVVYPDTQWPDNPAPDVCKGCQYIIDRVVTDQDALDMSWTRELKEPRFDTNLMEEKFLEPENTPGGPTTQLWQWINIETMPWNFTEFLLPDVDNTDCCDLIQGPHYGDYILVSSFLTEDSFQACVPAKIETLTADPMMPQVRQPIVFEATVNANADKPITYFWDFGSQGTEEITKDGTSDQQTFFFAEPGDYKVKLEVENDCGGEAKYLDITVDPCFGDFNNDGVRDTEDIGMMVPKWNSVQGDGVYEPRFDMTKDGKITLADIMQVVAVWNTSCPY